MYYRLNQKKFARKLAKEGDTYTFNSGKEFLDFLDSKGNTSYRSGEGFQHYFYDDLFNLGWELASYFSTNEGYQFIEEGDLDENGQYELWNGEVVTGTGVYNDDCEFVDSDKDTFLLEILEQLSYGMSIRNVVTQEGLGGYDWVVAKLINTDIKMGKLLDDIAEYNGYKLISFEEDKYSSESRTENCKITIMDTGENDDYSDDDD